MRRLVIALISASLLSCAARKTEDRKKAIWHAQLGIGHLGKGNIPQALGELLRADELDPNNPSILNNLGLAYFARGRLDLAEKTFRRALGVDGKFTEARVNLGRTLVDLKRPKEALRELTMAADDLLYPAPERIQTNLGLAYFANGDFDRAQTAFEKSVTAQRQNCTAWSFYGRSLYELSEFSRATQALDTAIEQCRMTKKGDSFYFAGLSYLKLGQKEKALARLEEGLSVDPDGEFSNKARAMLEILK